MPDQYGVFTTSERGHRFCMPLAESIASFHSSHCRDLPIVDYGCGDGSYVNFFYRYGILAVGIEGNIQHIHAPVIEQNLCILRPIKARKFSVSLEVGEHIPCEYSDVFLRNITHEAQYVALSWAIRGQIGLGHVNCMDNDEIVERMQALGFSVMQNETLQARNAISHEDMCPWFKNTFFFFKNERTDLD